MFERFTSFLESVPDNRPSIVEYKILDEGGAMIIYGEYGTLKSWIAMHLAASVSSGNQWLLYGTKPYKVGIINTELTRTEYQRRWVSFTRYHTIDKAQLLIYSPQQISLGEHVVHAVRDNHLGLLIIDNLYLSLSGDAKGSQDVKSFLGLMNKIRFEHNCAIVLIHHTRQPNIDYRGTQVDLQAYEMFGSSYLPNWADTIMGVAHVKDMKDCITIRPQKYRLMEAPPVSAVWKFERHRLDLRMVV